MDRVARNRRATTTGPSDLSAAPPGTQHAAPDQTGDATGMSQDRSHVKNKNYIAFGQQGGDARHW